MYQDLEHRSAVDRVQATTDLQGNPFLHVWLNAAAVLEVAGLIHDGRQLRGVVDARALGAWRSQAGAGMSGGRGESAAYRAAAVAREACRWVGSRSALDRVQAMKDLDGTPFVYVCMNAPGVLELAALVRDGRRLRAGVGGEMR